MSGWYKGHIQFLRITEGANRPLLSGYTLPLPVG
jgi:hypothetical protein